MIKYKTSKMAHPWKDLIVWQKSHGDKAFTASNASKAHVSSKVLIITYYWPPSGGAGVQRWLKFSKYLPEFGWDPVILTVDPEYAAYPVSDFSLKEDLPPSVKIYLTPATNYFSVYKKDISKIPTAGFANSVDNSLKGKILRFVRGNFFIPDPRKGWNKYAFKKACELIENEEIKHIITTSPPHSTQLIGLKLKKKYPQIKWIADLRDPWTDIYYYKQFYPTFISKWIDLRFEESVLKKADKIITVGTSLKNLFLSKVKGIANKTEVITNGYDEDDFSGIIPTDPSIFNITYVGTLSDNYPIDGFLKALHLFKEKGNMYTLRFIGTVSQHQKDLIQSETGVSTLDFIPYVDHPRAIEFMLKASVLLLIIPDHESNKSIITGKLFEYLASGKPIACIGPTDGDAAGIIKNTGHGITFSYSDSKGIYEYFASLISDKSTLEKMPVKAFSRKELTRKIIPLLSE
jgi:glycosyltransferase involved in cell wall biosynthesis